MARAAYLADRIYLTRANRAWLKSMDIDIVGTPLGRPPKQDLSAYEKRKRRKQRNQRSLVEGKIGQAKNGYGLGCIKARCKDTSESWLGAIFFVMNLVTLLKMGVEYFFLFFCRVHSACVCAAGRLCPVWSYLNHQLMLSWVDQPNLKAF